MTAQCALSVTYSEVHTVEYYINLASELIDMGSQEICIKINGSTNCLHFLNNNVCPSQKDMKQ